MKKYYLLLLLFFIVEVEGRTQQADKLKFTSVNQAGIAWGASGEGLQLQTINGISYRHFSAGLGVALDYYWERTIPVFIDLRKNIFVKKETPFLYADLGTNFPLVKENNNGSWYKSHYQQGLYYDLGIGYKLPIKEKLFAVVSFGYTAKKIVEKRDYEMVIIDFPPYDRNYSDTYKYTLRRLSLKAGLSF